MFGRSRQTSSAMSITHSARITVMLISTLLCLLCNPSEVVASSTPRRSHKNSTSEVGRRPTTVLPVRAEHVTLNQSASRWPSVAHVDEEEDDAVTESVTSLGAGTGEATSTLIISRHRDREHRDSDEGSFRTLRDGNHGDDDSRLPPTVQQQPVPPRWSRSGATRVIIYDRQNENHGNDDEGPTDADGLQDFETSPTPSPNLTADTWRTRMRSKQVRLFNILKDVNDYIGPRGRHRSTTGTTTATLSAPASAVKIQRRPVIECPPVTTNMKPGDKLHVRVDEDSGESVDSRLTVGQSTGGLRRRGPNDRMQQQTSDGCRTGSDDVTQRKAPTQAIDKDARRDVIRVTSSCSRRTIGDVTNTSTSLTLDAYDVSAETTASPIRKKSRHTPKNRRASTSGLWLEFELKPNARCCSANRRRNFTSLLLSTHLTLYKKPKSESGTRTRDSATDQTAMTSHSRIVSGHGTHRSRRMTSQHADDDVNNEMIRLDVFQRRAGHNTDNALKLIGSQQVSRHSEGWTVIDLTTENEAAKTITDLCRREATTTSGPSASTRRGGGSKTNKVTVELLVRATGQYGVAGDNPAESGEVGPRYGNRGRQRRRRIQEVHVHDLFRVPADCGNSDEAADMSSPNITRRGRRSPSERNHRVEDHAWSCVIEDGATQQHPVAEASWPRSRRPFIEFTWSANSPVGVKKSSRDVIRRRPVSES